MGVGLRPSYTRAGSSLIMKYRPSVAVQFLESDYDRCLWDWVSGFVHPDDETGWEVTFTLGPADERGERYRIQRPYSQAMFWLKDASEAGPSIEVAAEDMAEDECDACARDLLHRCCQCRAFIQHMTGALCARCWSESREGDALPLITSSLREDPEALER